MGTSSTPAKRSGRCFPLAGFDCECSLGREHRGYEGHHRLRILERRNRAIDQGYRARNGEQGIRANAIGAGVIETDILAGIVEDSRATLASYGYMHALGRVGQPEEIAQTVAWLASPRSSFVTGTLLMADGGYTASEQAAFATWPNACHLMKAVSIVGLVSRIGGSLPSEMPFGADSVF